MHTVRPLYAWEIREARRVFADQLKYEAIQVHENAGWPETVNKIGMRLKRMPYVDAPNAVTLGNHCYFSAKLLESPVSPDHPEHYKIGWLIHELTHAWQYQRLGWRYLRLALTVQLRRRAGAYDFGGEAGLVESYNRGRKLADFNLEQQGDITRTYYDALVGRKNVEAWLPFVREFQGKESA
jgi:hypothetical protein